MPIFDYLCPTCNTKEERLVKSSTDQQLCQCGSEMTKQLSSPCFILHGVGITSNGSFVKAKDGPFLDPELLSMPEADFNKEVGYSVD